LLLLPIGIVWELGAAFGCVWHFRARSVAIPYGGQGVCLVRWKLAAVLPKGVAYVDTASVVLPKVLGIVLT